MKSEWPTFDRAINQFHSDYGITLVGPRVSRLLEQGKKDEAKRIALEVTEKRWLAGKDLGKTP